MENPKATHTRSNKTSFKIFRKRGKDVSSVQSIHECDDSLPQADGNSTPPSSKYTAVVAIDFGTTYSGYAYAFSSDPTRKVQVMSHRLCGSQRGDGYGIQQPTVLLLTGDGQFHSFGFEAQHYYHDMDEYDAPNWLYFEKFKMELHSRKVRATSTDASMIFIIPFAY